MKKLSVTVILAVLLNVNIVKGATTNKNLIIWPYPQVASFTDDYYLIDSNKFAIVLDNSSSYSWSFASSNCDIIDAAIKRYQTVRFFPQDCSRLKPKYEGKFFSSIKPSNKSLHGNGKLLGNLKSVKLSLEGPCERYPYLHMNEAYQIVVNNGNEASIKAKTVWGALRGLETFSQLISYVSPNQFSIPVAKIQDFPRFSHRGAMIDSARHFLSLDSIRFMLDAMELNKLNVLHWHIVDDQSFPFVSITFPELSQKGSYNPVTHIYSVDDVAGIIEYARLRGIRVLTEFDTPGHAGSWGEGIPSILAPCQHVVNTKGLLDPTLNQTYEVVQKLFHEISSRFADKYIHLGGDEVDFTCWSWIPHIKEFMKKMNFGNDYSKLESYYIQKIVQIVEQLNRSYIVWQEVFDDNVTLKEDTVVQVWKSKDWKLEMKHIVSKGYQALLSAPWYLNYISYGTDWPKYYEIDPYDFNPTENEKSLIMGGEACMWGEWVDASNLIGRMWPRASAFAERLWSPQSLKKVNDSVRKRFHAQHCRMQVQGLRVEPIDGAGLFCNCDYAL